MNRLLLVILLVSLAHPALAATDQPQPQPNEPAATPRFEVGASAGMFTAIGGDAALLLATGPLVSINVTDRIGLDFVGEIVGPTESSGLCGIYQVRAKYAIREATRTQSPIFLTAGMAGTFKYNRQPEFREERPDGSVVAYHAHTHASLTRPVALSVGIGTQRRLAKYAAWRADGQAMFGFGGALLLRGALGISIPIGGYYAQTPASP
jgi:hypothetical protein